MARTKKRISLYLPEGHLIDLDQIIEDENIPVDRNAVISALIIEFNRNESLRNALKIYNYYK